MTIYSLDVLLFLFGTLWGIYPEKTIIEKNMCTRVFIAALFVIARTWKPEKAMATHSSILVWRIPCTEERGGLQFMGSQRVGHNRRLGIFLISFIF